MNDEQEDIHFEESDEEGTELSGAQKLKQLRDKLKEVEKEKLEYLTGWQRARADYSNLQKDLESTRIRAKSLVEEQLLSELIPVLDSFFFAFNNKEAWEAVDSNWRNGIEYIYNQLKGTLESHQFSAFLDIGKPFDPLRHEAVKEIETIEETLSGTVATTLKPGYLYRDTVIRPASVSVYKMK